MLEQSPTPRNLGVHRSAPHASHRAAWLAGDHLGSASLAMGTSNTSQRYYPYGGTRSGGVPTDYQFTGQKRDTGTGLYYYGARYYDGVSGRFISADTIVPKPGNPQDLNRYAYVRNNPLKYTDPTGMYSEEEIMENFGVKTWEEVLAVFEKGGALEGQWGWLEVLRRVESGDFVSTFYGPSLYRRGSVFSGHFNVEDGAIYIDLGNGERLSATAAAQLARDADVAGFETVETRLVTASWSVNREWKYYHVREVNAFELIVGGVDAAKMWGTAAIMGPLAGLLFAAGLEACTIGGPPGCVAGAMLALTAVPAAGISGIFLTQAASEYTSAWWARSILISP